MEGPGQQASHTRGDKKIEIPPNRDNSNNQGSEEGLKDEPLLGKGGKNRRAPELHLKRLDGTL